MNLLERVLTLLRANLNTVVENSDDPEKTLRQLQTDMRNQLVQVKTQVATTIAQSHSLQKRNKEKQTEADTWLHKAEQSIQQNNDDAARTALSRYNDIQKQAERYGQLQKEQEQLVLTMRSALRRLEAKIAEVETTIDLLVTRKRNALIQQRVYEALNKTGRSQSDAKTEKAQDAIIEAEARARALADLHRRDLDTQLDDLSADQQVEQQLQNLKAKQQQQPSQSPRLLPEGNGHPSPLLHPQPRSGQPISKHEAHPNLNASPQNSTPQTQSKLLNDSDIKHLKQLFDASQLATNED
jgi:phage shock protein A